MQKLILLVAAASLLTVPAEAHAVQNDRIDVRPGAFVGARFQFSLGGRSASKPRAALAIAPTASRISNGAIVQTRIGEGIALNFGGRPTMTLAGERADRALGFHSAKEVDADRRMGISTGGWIAIGLGAVAVGGGLYFLHLVDEAEENSE
jgi:hypothetical protein